MQWQGATCGTRCPLSVRIIGRLPADTVCWEANQEIRERRITMKLLLPVDGSDVSLKAVQVAMAMLQQGLAAEIVLANVQEPANLYEMMTAPDPDVLERVSQAAGADILEPAQAMLTMAKIGFESEVAGEIIKVHAENGHPVQFGEILFTIKTA